MIDIIRNWFFRKDLLKKKRRVLFEVEKDLQYLKKFKAFYLNFDEDKARARMAELKKKEDRTDKEQAELEEVVGKIAMSKAVKNEWEKSQELRDDLNRYISIIE